MERILIVEDDEKLRKELAFFLNHNGYEAEELCRYETLVEDILDSGCDLVLLDINLPVVDGQYVCREVRKKSDVPIIMVTSRNSDLDQLISMNYGADDYVEKPFHPHWGDFKKGQEGKWDGGDHGLRRMVAGCGQEDGGNEDEIGGADEE